MNLVCCIKQVPDTAEVKIDPATNTLMRSGVESISNPYDLVALEGALTLKEKYGGWVTAVSMGPPQAEQVLKEAISLGADAAVLLSDRAFAGADTLATSYTLYKAIQRLGQKWPVDVVFCGKQAIDGDTAQVGPGIAARLGFTQFTCVTEVRELSTFDRHITVKRRVEDGFEVIRGPLPAVVTVELDFARPRRASLSRLILSLRAVIDTWGAEAIGAQAAQLGLKGSPTWVRRIFSPPLKEGGPVFDAQKDPLPAVERFLDSLFSDEMLTTELWTRKER